MAVPEVSLRPATAADTEFACDTTRETMREYTLATWGEWKEDDARRRVAGNIAAGETRIIELDGVPIGIQTVTRDSECIQLLQLFIRPQHQNRGIGSKLIRQLLQEAQIAGLPLRLRVLRVNPAFALYKRLGFKVVQEAPERFFMEHPG